MLTKRQFLLMLEKYQESVQEYLTLSKDASFKFMEELVAEIEDEEGLEWTDAYDTFNEMVDAVAFGKFRREVLDMNAKLEFSEVFIGRLFHFNGNDYIKLSNRTARMLSNGRAFYIGKKEFVHYISY